MWIKIFLLSVLIFFTTCKRYETREDYINRFAKAVVYHCQDCFDKIEDEELRSFFKSELPTYENVEIRVHDNKLIKVQMFEDEEMTKQGEMFFLDTMPYTFCLRTFQERGFYPKAIKEDL